MTNDDELAQWPVALQAPFRFYGNDGTKFPKNCPTVWFDFNYCHRVRLFRGPERQSTFHPPPPTKRFPLSRCAFAIQIVRPSESTAETQPQLQPAFLRLSATISSIVSRLLLLAEFLETRIGAQRIPFRIEP